jgi:glutamate racemase
MSNKPKALGIFDSGVGGLTVVKSLMSLLPSEQIYYLADTINLPYGTKSAEELESICNQNIQFLSKQPLKALVIACNTASAHAYESLKMRFNFPIFEVITPSVEEALKKTKNKKIAVLGTQSLIDSKMYEKLIKNREPDAEVLSIPCPLLVSVVEESLLSHKLAELLVRQYLKPVVESDVDTVILGCTHYPLMVEIIRKELKQDKILVDSSECCVQNIKNYLETNKLLTDSKKTAQHFYFVSGCPETFDLKSSAILKQKINSVKKEEQGA